MDLWILSVCLFARLRNTTGVVLISALQQACDGQVPIVHTRVRSTRSRSTINLIAINMVIPFSISAKVVGC
ncbi:hypothetical protein V8F20_011773 [Naviculisporaceae sp. PSN 640]